MPSDRRQFLTHLSLGGAALAALPGTLHARERTSQASPAATLHGLVHALEQPVVQGQFDTTWPQKLSGKYKAVFDVPEINGGIGVWRAGLWCTHYSDLLGAQPTDLCPVIVIRHSAIPLIMTHEFWEMYDVGKANKVTHPLTDKKTRRNPVLMSAEDDGLSPMLANIALDKQMERGATVLACNMAFSSMTALVRKQDKLPGAEARAKAMSMMLPGVIMQPNGIFGLTLAQDQGCAFVAAS
jgi:hypothetical protein